MEDFEAIVARIERQSEGQFGASMTDIQLVIDKARAGDRFKSYVHERLDAAGVPTHPDGPHSAEGCRVGDRLDIALAYYPAKEAAK